VIAVADTGIGIAEADLGRVLEAFVQVSTSLERNHDGTRLGLPLSKRLTEMMGGTLTLASRPGAGTHVTLRFPLPKALAAAA
jgi:signal transduction histidine kinase